MDLCFPTFLLLTYDCRGANKLTLKDAAKSTRTTATKQDKTQTVCIFWVHILYKRMFM